ncbi:hypothetical protein BGX29_011411 [Mortierella sp. GBA35]|nr:hypothetical protein BGX29_011411 [Mortierella sp. GBA35]
MSATARAQALPGILTLFVTSAGKQFLPTFRLVSRSFLQACAPSFFITIPDPFFHDPLFHGKQKLSKEHVDIVQNAGHLLKSLSLGSNDSNYFDVVASSAHLQRLRLDLDNQTTTDANGRLYGPLFKEGTALGTQLTDLVLLIYEKSFTGSIDKWNAHFSPRCLLDPESGTESPLGSILARLLSLEIINDGYYN